MLLLMTLMLNTTPPGTISVTITNLRNSSGQVGCRLFDRERGFPVDESAAIQSLWAPISGSEARVTFRPVPPGVYAVACFHDENGNCTFDLGLFGIPLEGSVASNDARGRFGPPSFRSASFTFDGKPADLRLAMRY